MRKIIITVLLMLVLTSPVFAVVSENKSASSSASTPTITEEKEVKNLKERVASKVAEMRKKDQRAVSGILTNIKDNALTVHTYEASDEKEYQIKVDNTLTQVYFIVGNSKKEAKISELKQNSYIIVTGPVIDSTIQANYIYIDEQYLLFSGKITEVNTTSFYFKMLTTDKDELVVDVETATKQLMLNIKTMEIEKTGFSKVKEGDTIHLVVKNNQSDSKEKKEKNRYTAKKILVIPQEYFNK